MQCPLTRSGMILGMAVACMVGCVPSEVRRGADMLAAFTHQVSEEGADFVRSRTALAQARRANIAMLELNAVELENSVNRDVEVWELSGGTGNRRAQLLKGIRAFSNDVASRNAELADLRKRHEAAVSATKSAVDLRQTELSKVSKALANLAQDLDMKSELEFFVGYFKEVRAGVEKAKKTADEHVTAGEIAATNAVPKE